MASAQEERNMETVEVSGRTVDDAIAAASAQLGIPADRLDYTIVSEGSKGILGIGAEDARIAVRHVRRDGIEALRRLEKDGEISQDEHRKLEKDVQHLTDEHIKRVDETLAQKDKEILQV